MTIQTIVLEVLLPVLILVVLILAVFWNSTNQEYDGIPGDGKISAGEWERFVRDQATKVESGEEITPEARKLLCQQSWHKPRTLRKDARQIMAHCAGATFQIDR